MTNKTVWITGASGGIGRATAAAFAAAGYRVAAGYCRNKEAVLALQREYPDILPVYADIASRGEVEHAASEILHAFGQLDVLVNNAGIAQQKLFTDITDADWDRMMGVNLRGTFYCCQAVLPGMIRQKSGRIINVSSVWGQKGASCEVHYSTAKAGVIGLTKALAKEEGLSGITVNCVAPGVILTEMNGHLDADTIAELREGTPLNRLGTPEEVASVILFLASDEASFITGQVIGVNGGFGE